MNVQKTKEMRGINDEPLMLGDTVVERVDKFEYLAAS
jgi:hypothetical protein